MNRKISLGIAISLIAIGCAITFVLTWTASLTIYNSKIANNEKYEAVYKKLKELDATVRGNYIGVIDGDFLENSIIMGYVNGIGDKYASYMPANSYYMLQQTTSGVVNGAGFEAVEDGSGYLRVTTVYNNSSADANGMAVGDIITAIDGRSLLDMDANTAFERISGDIGTKLSLTILRNGEQLSMTLIRQQVEVESVTDELLEGNIGYIKISTFNNKTPDQFSTSLNSLTARGMKGLIIDLRHNGGGVVNSLQPMLNRLIGTASVAVATYADGSSRSLIETDSEESLSIPIAVLVDGGTASASELFAAALRDEKNAVLVGVQTYGKGVIQTTYSFSDGSAASFSTATISLTKSGSYDKVGLKPDYTVELPSGTSIEYLTRDSDSQLQKATEVLSAAIASAENSAE